MGLFKRRREQAAYPEQDQAEEIFESEEGLEAGGRVGHGGTGASMWGTLHRHTSEEEKLELRAQADPESDTAEARFIRSEREAEERGRWGEPPR
ncbi:MAG TPA: hypothetical protein VGS61_04345 [Acidimicrobiales bacterium]|nr:hypothetical protein [Acidimicrobiales bacterium]